MPHLSDFNVQKNLCFLLHSDALFCVGLSDKVLLRQTEGSGSNMRKLGGGGFQWCEYMSSSTV